MPDTLTPGRQVGPYEILAPLGAGGMGEVYRARDTRLRREVALKVLPADVAGDATRRARFEQEAHAAAALNHPNILGIHDVGTDAGVFYMATELVTGETLAAAIERGAVPIRTLLDIAVQIADGMAAAHAAGIVHRDLKPANVMIATDGRVKILDFGLAKQTTRTPVVGDETVLANQTEPGMIVGTVNYMSPEQARGQAADYRSDQFSFGLMLYEMASGGKPFAKVESVQTMAAIISEEPPPIDTKLPAPLRWIIDRCLAKEPASRYESSRDLFRELRNIRDHLSEVSTQVEKVAPVAVAPAKRRTGWALVAAAFVLGGVAVAALVAFGSGPPLPDQSSYRFTPFSFEPGGQAGPVWSPDGKAVAYAARQQRLASYQLYVRYLDAPTAVQLTNLPNSPIPVAWTPDSRRILVIMDDPKGALWSVAAVGGEPQQFMSLADEHETSGDVTVSPDNKSVAVLMRREGLQVGISSPVGSPVQVYKPDPFASKMVFNRSRIRFSPDGRHLLLMMNGGRQSEEAWLLPYPPNGTAPKRVLPELRSYGGTPFFAWMPDSRRIMLSLQSDQHAQLQLWLADVVSNEMYALTSGEAGRGGPSVSPDGERVIFSHDSGHFDVASVDLATGAVRTVVATQRNDLMAAWASAEPALVYVTDRAGPYELWLHRENTVDQPIVTSRAFTEGTTNWLMGPALSPRADRVIYTRVEAGTVARLWISALSGGTAIQLTNDTATEFPGSWSPDGTWFTYYALRDGKASLMKVKTSGQARPEALAEGSRPNAGGARNAVPVWSPAGNWILAGTILVSPDGKTTREIADRGSAAYVFSKDGSLLYGVRRDKQQQLLFSIDVATLTEKIIGPVSDEFSPGSNLSPSMRFSLSPDGKSFVCGSGQFTSNLWMLEGFNKTTRPFAALFGRDNR